MKPFLRHLFLLFGCLHLIGGPYSLVQVYAWANMIIGYSSETGFSQAVADTFSGEKPCCLCKKITAAKAEESRGGKQDLPAAFSASKLPEHLFPPSEIQVRDPRHTAFSPSEIRAGGTGFTMAWLWSAIAASGVLMRHGLRVLPQPEEPA